MTLHDLNQAALYADRVALMQQGQIVAQGLAAEVFTPEALSRVYGCLSAGARGTSAGSTTSSRMAARSGR
jgi:iron complex transport system ATP-binding protein